MKYFILFILLLSSVALAAQSTLPLRADTVVVEKTGGSGELKIKNSTRDSLGLLVNIGGGRTRFMKVRKLNDSTLIFPPSDTVVIASDLWTIDNNNNLVPKNLLSVKLTRPGLTSNGFPSWPSITTYNKAVLGVYGVEPSIDILSDSTSQFQIGALTFRSNKLASGATSDKFPRLPSSRHGANAYAQIEANAFRNGTAPWTSTIEMYLGDSTGNNTNVPFAASGPGSHFFGSRRYFTAEAKEAFYFGTAINRVDDGSFGNLNSFFAGNLNSLPAYLFNLPQVSPDSTTNKVIVYNPSTSAVNYMNWPATGGGGGGTPGGANTQIQYNASGAFAGDAGLTYNATTNKVATDSINVLTQNFDTLRRNVTGLYGRDTLYWFGDSHTTGTGATVTGRRYSTQTSAFLGYVEKNLGAGGTLMQGNSTIIPNIPYKSASTPGSKLVINFGTNDGIFRDGAPGTYDTTTFKTDYIRWIDSAIARGWTAATDILIVQMEYSTLSGIQTEWLDYKRATQTVAETKGTLFIPTWDLMLANAGAGFVSSDGFHPNDAGYSYTSSLIINKLRGSVKGNDQAVAINGLVEVQNLRMRNMDSSGYTSRVVEADSLGYFRLAQSNKYIHNNSSTTNLDAAAIGISNMAYSNTAFRSPRIELIGNSNGSARDLGGSGMQGWHDGTGGHWMAYNWTLGSARNMYFGEFGGTNQFGSGTINTNARVSVGGSVIATGPIQAGGSFGSAGSGTYTQIYYDGTVGGLQTWNHTGSSAVNQSINGFGGLLMVGTHTVNGSARLQVDGESYLKDKITVGRTRTFNNQGLTGLFLTSPAATYTDNNTAISGTVAHVTGASLFAPTLAAASTGVTFTNASTLYVSGAPAAGANVTLTNPWAFHVATGAVKLGDWTYDGTTVKQNNATAATSITSSTAIGASSGGDIRLLAAATPTAADQRLGGVMFGTLDGGSTENLTASIEGYSTAAHTPGSSEGTHLRFLTTAVATRSEVMRITANLRVGIGVTSPGASLHLRAGNSSSGGAPFMFTSGTNLATPAAGAMEYDGTSFFATPGSTRLRKVLTNNSIPTNGQIPIGDGANYTNATITQGLGISVTNGAGSITLAIPTSYITSGTYTPTITNGSNVAASTPYECQYMRVGDVVTVSGRIDIDPTAISSSTQLTLTLPITSAFAGSNNLGGTAFCPNIAGLGAAIMSDGVDKALIQFVPSDASNNPFTFSFTYRIIVP